MNEKERFIYDCEFSNQAKVAFEWLRDRKIEPILIKGWWASQNYPSDHFRQYGDLDLIVQEETPQKIVVQVENEFPDQVDLHLGPRNHDTLTYEKLLRNSELRKLINGYEIRLAGPEDHLRIMSTHWLNDGGIAKIKLWDIYYAVANRPVAFDWGKCLDVVSPIRRKWVLTTIFLAHFYLQLPINDLPFADEINEPGFVPKWIFETLEKEWNSHVPLIQLVNSFGSAKTLIQQVNKRLIPNPIQSAVYAQASFDDSSRILSHFKATYLRVINIPSVARSILRKRKISENIGKVK